jgi:hypothetical protein
MFSFATFASSAFVSTCIVIVSIAIVSWLHVLALVPWAAEASGTSVIIYSPSDGQVVEVTGPGFEVLLSANFPEDDLTHQLCIGVDGKILECFLPSLMQRGPEDGGLFLGLHFSTELLRTLHDGMIRGHESQHVLFGAILSNLAVEENNLEQAAAIAEIMFLLVSPEHEGNGKQNHGAHRDLDHLAMQELKPPRRATATPDRYEAQWGNISTLLPVWPLPCTREELKINSGFPRHLFMENSTRPVVVASWIKWFDTLGFDERDIAACSVPCLFMHIPSTNVRQECTDESP